MKIRICPKCGKHNLVDAWYCVNTSCRETLSVNTVTELDDESIESDIKAHYELAEKKNRVQGFSSEDLEKTILEPDKYPHEEIELAQKEINSRRSKREADEEIEQLIKANCDVCGKKVHVKRLAQAKFIGLTQQRDADWPPLAHQCQNCRTVFCEDCNTNDLCPRCSSRSIDALEPESIWIRSGKPISWPSVCIRCCKPGEMTTDVADSTVTLELLGVKEGSSTPLVVVPYSVKTTTYTSLVQHVKPPYCQDCARAIKEYNEVSKTASCLGAVGAFLIAFLGIGIAAAIGGIIGPEACWGVVLAMIIGVGVMIAGWFFAGPGIVKWYKNWKNPPKATKGVYIGAWNADTIRFQFLNAEYGQLFTEANRSILTSK